MSAAERKPGALGAPTTPTCDPKRTLKLDRLYNTERFRSDSPAAGSTKASALAPLGPPVRRLVNDPAR
jgi:hypothetical protein